MQATLLAWALFSAAPAPATAHYLMTLDEAPVGRVRIELEPGGRGLVYESELISRRGRAVIVSTARAQARLAEDGRVAALASERREGGSVVADLRASPSGDRLALEDGRVLESGIPSVLAFAALARAPGCLRVVEETTLKAGQACGRLEGAEVRGSLLGEAFSASVDGDGLPSALALPGQRVRFQRVSEAPRLEPPPGLLGGGLAAEGLPTDEPDRLLIAVHAGRPLMLPPSASQRAEPTTGGAAVQWRREAPAAAQPARGRGELGRSPIDRLAERCLASADAWAAAACAARAVDEAIPSKEPHAGERDPAKVLAAGRGTCVGHTALFLEVASRLGVRGRRAVGLVAAEGRLWPHVWPQVEIGGRWFDVEPTAGEAPALSPRILLGAGEEEQAGARLLLDAPGWRVAVSSARPPDSKRAPRPGFH